MGWFARKAGTQPAGQDDTALERRCRTPGKGQQWPLQDAAGSSAGLSSASFELSGCQAQEAVREAVLADVDAGCWMLDADNFLVHPRQGPAPRSHGYHAGLGVWRAAVRAWGWRRQTAVRRTFFVPRRPSVRVNLLPDLAPQPLLSIFTPHSQAIPEGTSANRHYSIFEPWALKL